MLKRIKNLPDGIKFIIRKKYYIFQYLKKKKLNKEYNEYCELAKNERLSKFNVSLILNYKPELNPNIGKSIIDIYIYVNHYNKKWKIPWFKIKDKYKHYIFYDYFTE